MILEIGDHGQHLTAGDDLPLRRHDIGEPGNQDHPGLAHRLHQIVDGGVGLAGGGRSFFGFATGHGADLAQVRTASSIGPDQVALTAVRLEHFATGGGQILRSNAGSELHDCRRMTLELRKKLRDHCVGARHGDCESGNGDEVLQLGGLQHALKQDSCRNIPLARFWQRSVKLPARNMSPPLPQIVAWNLTQRCDLSCPHCYISAGPQAQRNTEISAGEFRRITNEILALNPSPLFILSGGEPLVRDDLERLAKTASDKGATVVVGTNGTLLTQERIDSLIAAGVSGFAVSVDSLDRQRHDTFRGRSGAFDQTMAAIERLGTSAADFLVQTTLTSDNQHELGDLAQWALEAGAMALNIFVVVKTGRGGEIRGMSPEDAEAASSQIAALEQQYRGRLMVRSKCQPNFVRHVWALDPEAPLLQRGTRCPAGVTYVRVTPDARLTPCPYMPLVAGDLRDDTFGNIWTGSEVLTTLRGTPEGKCGSCEFTQVCGGCRARPWLETGQLMASDPSCSHEPAPDTAPLNGPTAPTSSNPELEWTDEARRRMQRIPSFVRGMVIGRVETAAKRDGHCIVTVELLDELRGRMPADVLARFRSRHPS